MKKTASILSMLVVTLAFVACNKGMSKDDVVEPAASDKAQVESVSITPGAYDVSLACADEGQTPAAMPDVKMTYTFNEDGTYSESIKNLDKTCKKNCEIATSGTYKATREKFTLEQMTPAVKDGSYAKEVVQIQEFSAIQYASADASQMVLMDETPENACGGRMTWTLTKQPTAPVDTTSVAQQE